MGSIAFEEGFEKVADVARNAMALLRIGSIRENTGGDGQHVVEIWGKRGLSFLSWGEIIGIKVSGNEQGGSLVEAISECVVPTTIIDYGQNRKNLESLFAALKMQLRIAGPVHIEEKRFGSG